MQLLIVEPLEEEVRRWLAQRHEVRQAPELMHDQPAFRRALRDVRGLLLPPSLALDAHALRQAPALRIVGCISAGGDNVDVDACARANVEVVRSVTATSQAEAEFMIGALITMLRRVPVIGSHGMRVGRELGSARVGLVGMAPAARSLSKMLGAFGSVVYGYDPALHATDEVWARWGVQPSSLRELVESCDALCVQLSYFSRFRGLFGERLLRHCRPNQVIVSISHSAMFDEHALARELQRGRIAAAWFDSVEPGALDAGRPLANLDALQVSPRVASTTRESRLRSAWAVARRLDEALAHGPGLQPQVATPPPWAVMPARPDVPRDLAID